MSIAFAIIGLAVLVLVHEAGHFFTALATGMRPRRFYVGFPPALVKTTRGGVEFGIGAIPLGGYVKIPGMFRPGRRDTELYLKSAAEDDPALAEPVEALGDSLERGDLEQARSDLAGVGERLGKADLSPRSASFARRGVEEIGDALAPDAYWRQPTWKRLVVIGAGPVTNILVAIVIFASLYMLNLYRLGFIVKTNPKSGATTTRVDSVLASSPAKRAGLRPGDVVVSVNGHEVNGSTLIKRIGSSGGHPIALTVRRHGKLVHLPAVAPMNEADSPPTAFVDSLRLTGRIIDQIVVKGIGRLFIGKGGGQVSGPVGIVKSSSDAYRHGFSDYLFVVGLISLSLGVLNLLPLLPLDGGHVAFSLVERLRGRVLSREIYERVSAVGIALVALLFVLGLSNDIGRVSG
jgi:regulator of sigma E protease